MIAPPLVGMVVILALLAFWVLPRTRAPQTASFGAVAKAAQELPSRPTAPAAMPAAASTAIPHGVRAPAVIRERAGKVGVLRLGMGLPAAGEELGEELIPVQRATARSTRFKAVAPRSGVVVEGRAGRIDTITVTNAGAAGRLWKTPDDLGIASRMRLVPRMYPSAQKICGREFWVTHGPNTARWAGGGRVTSYTLTSLPPALYAACA